MLINQGEVRRRNILCQEIIFLSTYMLVTLLKKIIKTKMKREKMKRKLYSYRTLTHLLIFVPASIVSSRDRQEAIPAILRDNYTTHRES